MSKWIWKILKYSTKCFLLNTPCIHSNINKPRLEIAVPIIWFRFQFCIYFFIQIKPSSKNVSPNSCKVYLFNTKKLERLMGVLLISISSNLKRFIIFRWKKFRGNDLGRRRAQSINLWFPEEENGFGILCKFADPNIFQTAVLIFRN